MACENSLSAFVAQCGDNLRAGTKKVYMLAYHDAEVLDDSIEIYALSVNGVVNEIGLKASKKFVKVEASPKTETITETHTVGENGIITSNVSFALQLGGFGKESGQFVKSLLGVPVIVLSQLGNGKWVAVGLDGNFKLSESVGTHSATDSNRALTFNGDIFDSIPEVDGTIITTLI